MCPNRDESAILQPAETELPRWLWLGFPPLLLLPLVVSRLKGREAYDALVRSELGLIENMTLVVLCVAIVLSVMLFLRRRAVGSRLFGPLMAIMVLGLVYFAGEEASWGYHFFDWEVLGGLTETNNQGEPNLHNQEGFLGGLLDQLPRTLLSIAAAGGILIPLIARRRKLPMGKYWLLPTIVCLPTCVLALTITLPRKIFKAIDLDDADRILRQGETKEYFLALFLMLYMASLYARLRAGKLPPASA